jgi:hypothetical protein
MLLTLLFLADAKIYMELEKVGRPILGGSNAYLENFMNVIMI